MLRWHHQLNGHEFEQTPGDGEGQGSLVCCSPWGCRELDMTKRLNNNNKYFRLHGYAQILLQLNSSRPQGLPHSPVGKESACNAGDPSLIPVSGRLPGDGIGSPLQYSLASLVAQLVKNLPVMWESRVRSLGWEDPLEKGKAIHTSILAWRITWTVQPMGLKRV